MCTLLTLRRKQAEKEQHKGRTDEMIDYPPPLSFVLSSTLSLLVCLSSLTKQKRLNLPQAIRDPCQSECCYLFQQAPNSPLLSTIVLIFAVSLDFHCFQKLQIILSPLPALPLLLHNAESKHFITHSASPYLLMCDLVLLQ